MGKAASVDGHTCASRPAMTGTDRLRTAMAAHGLDYAGPIYPDGKLYRIKVAGDCERNSWYVLHAGPPNAGAFGCWKRGVKETWCERQPREMSQTEWDFVRERWRRAEQERDKVQPELQIKAR